MELRDFEGKVVVVTGGGGGVGLALCRQFAERGARVVGVGRTAAKLELAAEVVRGAGGEAQIVVADITAPDAAARVIEACNAFGGVDTLINNAAVGYSYEKLRPGSMASLAGQSPALWREVIDINLNGPAMITQALIPKLLERAPGASIVFISSVMSYGGYSHAHAYAAAKAAINNLVKSLAVTHGPAGLRTNCVAPGLIETEMAEAVFATGLLERDESRFAFCPLGRAATADEVASAALFLASSSAAYINGAVLTVDGGTSAKG